MYPSYLSTLKAFVEGQKDLREWPAWWRENAQLIEEIDGRTLFLKIKLEWQKGACQILQQHGIEFQVNEAINWDRCKQCGEPLFHARPHQTTKEQIQGFARTSNVPDKEQIEQEGWIHPGSYCVNGCTAVLISYDREAAENMNRGRENES
jgi:hypothetical protein